MKTKTLFPSAGILLGTLVTGFSQPILQFSESTCTVAVSASSVTHTVQRARGTNAEMSADFGITDPSSEAKTTDFVDNTDN
jgi:hypothetical protein